MKADPNSSTSLRVALLTLDMQRDFLDGRGKLPVAAPQVNSLISTVNRLLEEAPKHGWVSVLARNEYSPWDVSNIFRNFASLRGSVGAEFDPRLMRKAVAAEFSKTEGDAFSNPKLAPFLRAQGVRTVVITGVFADACVTRTAVGAMNQGFRPVVVSDGVASGNASSRDRALAALRDRGVAVESSTSLLEQVE
ncbi:MAG: cysteine hydrolase family protein [Rhizomicrobium sp.]